MHKRSRGPRWELLGASVAIVAAVAALTSSGLVQALPAAGAWGLRDWLEIAIILTSVLSVFFVPILVLAAFVLPPRREVDPDWRRRLGFYRTTGALARQRLDEAAAARACGKLCDDALRVAAILPGHSEAGRAAARDALAARGVPPDPVPEIRVPSFWAIEDLPTARRAAMTANRIRMVCGGGQRACSSPSRLC